MNLRCLYCQTPFTLSRVEMLSALVIMNEKNQNHYDAHCPRCRRANSISRQRMELFFPNWREAAKQQAAAAETAAKEPAPAATSLKTEPVAKTVKKTVKAVSGKKTAGETAKSSAQKKPDASKSDVAKKSPSSKTSSPAKKTSAKDKKK
ncbi:MAG: hypothetical protein QY328_18785 [Anaerolineales bacterium]|nr:MAG: hypothetical protein QY328_18785 [Anaerolineales bacterium]